MNRFSTKTYVQNLLLERTAWLRKLLDPRRDITAECGHPETVEIKDYVDLFDRGDIAKRVVTVYPEESWSESPEIVENETDDETEFERTWKELEDKFKIWSYLQRVDILSGIGRFGILLLGFDDGEELSSPIEGGDHQLLPELHAAVPAPAPGCLGQ